MKRVCELRIHCSNLRHYDTFVHKTTIFNALTIYIHVKCSIISFIFRYYFLIANNKTENIRKRLFIWRDTHKRLYTNKKKKQKLGWRLQVIVVYTEKLRKNTFNEKTNLLNSSVCLQKKSLTFKIICLALNLSFYVSWITMIMANRSFTL